MFGWFWKRVFTPERVGFLVDKFSEVAEARAKEIAKEAAIGLLEDQDIAQGVTQYGDALYERYSRKFFGALGGTQKGINYAVSGAVGDMAPQIIDKDGNLSLKSIIGWGIQKAINGQFNTAPAGPSRPVKNPFDVK